MRLIDADAFLQSEIERCGCVPLIGSCTSDNEIFKFILENQPTVDAKPVVHGEWVEYEVPHIICCSECDWGTSIDEKGFKFCPNCGADMRGGKNE